MSILSLPSDLLFQICHLLKLPLRNDNVYTEHGSVIAVDIIALTSTCRHFWLLLGPLRLLRPRFFLTAANAQECEALINNIRLHIHLRQARCIEIAFPPVSCFGATAVDYESIAHVLDRLEGFDTSSGTLSDQTPHKPVRCRIVRLTLQEDASDMTHAPVPILSSLPQPKGQCRSFPCHLQVAVAQHDHVSRWETYWPVLTFELEYVPTNESMLENALTTSLTLQHASGRPWLDFVATQKLSHRPSPALEIIASRYKQTDEIIIRTTYEGIFPRPQEIQAVLSHFPCLQHLAIIKWPKLHYGPTSEWIHGLSRLKALTLSIPAAYEFFGQNPEDKIFPVFPNLKLVQLYTHQGAGQGVHLTGLLENATVLRTHSDRFPILDEIVVWLGQSTVAVVEAAWLRRSKEQNLACSTYRYDTLEKLALRTRAYFQTYIANPNSVI